MSLTTPAYSASEQDIKDFFLAAAGAEILAVDTETILDDVRDGRGYAMGVSVAFRFPGLGIVSNYFPFRHETHNLDRSYKEQLKLLLEGHKCLVFHNAKFDIVSLTSLNIIVSNKFYDTMLMAHMVNENEPFSGKGLDSLSKHYLNDTGKRKSEEFVGAIKYLGWNRLPPYLMHEYAAYDAVLTLRLWEYLQLEWDAQELEPLWQTEQDWTRLLIKMEGRGVRINGALVEGELDRGQKRMAEISEQLGLNPASPTDLEKLLISELQLPVVKKTPTGRVCFDKEAMREYEALLAASDDDRASLILEYRGYQKTTSSNYRPYLELLSPDGRLRPNYKIHGTVTGRLSCEKPNLQQIPRVSDKAWNGRLKEAFIAEPGYKLWEADYSQLELRLGAAYAQETELLEVFNSGRDVFDEMARELGMPRHETKTLTYTLQYGGGATRLSNVFGVSVQKAMEIKDEYFDRYPGFRKMAQRASSRCRAQGYLRLWSGRRRHFSDPQNEAHKAFNSVIQGGAAEIVKHSMLRLSKEIDSDSCRMLLQVHDSVLFEIKIGMEDEFIPRIQKIMEAVEPDFGVHFAVQVKEWGH